MPQNRRSEFHSYVRWIKEIIGGKIKNLPRFECYLTEDLYGSHHGVRPYIAFAHFGKSRAAQKKNKLLGDHWVIEFSQSEFKDIEFEMVLYHEIAHFVTHAINAKEPLHGLLWSAAFDALSIMMELDECGRLEAEYLFECDREEISQTLINERVGDVDGWRQIRSLTSRILEGELSRFDVIQYVDLAHLIWYSHTKARLSLR